MRLFPLALLFACRAFGGAYSLCDGSFNGWEGDTTNTWRLEEGAFAAGSLDKMQPRNEFLCTKKEFGDFDLTVKWKLEGTEGFVNGGVQFRTKRIPNHHEVSGYQADLGAGYDGALYDESRRNKMLAQPAKDVLEKAKKPPGEWNTYRIRAEGPRIQIWLNGVQTVDFTETDKDIPLTGIIAVQIHGNAKTRVWYKDIVIEELGSAKAAAGPVQQRFADPVPAPPREPFQDGKFAIRPGEVVVFTGGANMAWEAQYAWLESMLCSSLPGKSGVRFRNMAWEGDTVFEQWRDMNFGTWREQMDAVNATCVFLCFGQMESGQPGFVEATAKLLDGMMAITPRVVLVEPLPSWNGPAEHVEELGELAAKRGIPFARVFWPADDPKLPPDRRPVMSLNGIHFTSTGWKHVAAQIVSSLGLIVPSLDRPELREAIIRKNRFWHDCWKTMNWAFAYSDRTEQPFGKGIGEHPPMARELEQYKPLLRRADEVIHALLDDSDPPEAVLEVPPPPAAPAQPPAEELQSFKVRDGFAVNLFASEADGLVKPLSMRWDERGRLWAACSPAYPQLVPGESRRDFILVCEDTDGDGRADKFRRFAEGLTMPMGIEFAADGGVYVCESTQLAHFRDRDGDGVADERTIVLSGFGTGDSHQMINSLRWGPDGCLWFTQGMHIFSRIETPHGIVRLDRAGLWRFNPRTWKLDGFFGNAVAGANCWGVTFDDWGQVFHCAADNTPGFYTTPGLGAWPNPPSYYNVGPLAVSPVKGMCMEFINGSHLPPELQGVLCKPVYFANQILLYKLVEDGSGFKTTDLGPLLTSSSNAFRPLGVQTGPDGALYVCDWYNPVIGHYQASYRDPARDKVHGRIWRIAAKDRAPVQRPEFGKMDAAALLTQLHSPERWVRDQARRLLAAKPAAELSRLYFRTPEDEQPAYLLEVLAVQAGQGSVDTRLLHRCLASDEPRLRAFALRVWSQIASLADHGDAPDDEEYQWKILANGVNDPHPRVRLEAVIAAGYLKDTEAVEIALGALDHPRDRFLDYALANTVRATKPVWQPALEKGKMKFDGNTGHLAFLLQADGNPDTAGVLQKIIAGGSAPAESRSGLRVLLINAGSPEQLRIAIEGGPPDAAIIEALIGAARTRGVRPPGDFRTILADWDGSAASLAGDGGEDAPFLFRVQLCRLAAAWGYDDIAARLKDLTRSARSAVAVAAVRAWADYRGAAAVADLVTLAGDSVPQVAAAAAGELMRLDAARGCEFAAAGLAGGWPEDVAQSLLPDVLGVSGGPDKLAAALAAKAPRREVALGLLKALATAGRSEPALAAVLRRAAGLPENASVVPDYSAEFVSKLVATAKSSGDAARGKDVFHAAQSACIGCHTVGDTGGQTGPNLTAVGRGMTPELITESLLWPRRQIKEGYFLTTVTTRDGRVVSGYKVSEDAKTLVLKTPGGTAAESVDKAAVKDRSDTGTLMPDGLTAWMSEQQRLDLLRYLFDLGR